MLTSLLVHPLMLKFMSCGHSCTPIILSGDILYFSYGQQFHWKDQNVRMRNVHFVSYSFECLCRKKKYRQVLGSIEHRLSPQQFHGRLSLAELTWAGSNYSLMRLFDILLILLDRMKLWWYKKVIWGFWRSENVYSCSCGVSGWSIFWTSACHLILPYGVLTRVLPNKSTIYTCLSEMWNLWGHY